MPSDPVISNPRRTRKRDITRWTCPTCGHSVVLRFLPPDPPHCTHVGTPRAAARPAVCQPESENP